MQSITIGTNQAGQRLDKFLHKYLPQAGSGFLYKMLRKKNITLNGKKAEGKEMLSVGDEIRFYFSEETFAKFSAAPVSTSADIGQEYIKAYKTLLGITVLFEDENIVVLNKPVGILTQKTAANDLSLNEWLIGYLLTKGAITATELRTFHPSVCNRLDRNTSGIVLCGKSLAGSQALSYIIKNRTIQKFYRTVCVGQLTQDETLRGYLHKDKKTNIVTIRQDLPETSADKEYSPIHTAYHPIVWNEKYTLLEVELITGKTHQIRSHLSSINHPIIGDGKYGNPGINQELRNRNSLRNQLLHAYRIVFPQSEGVLAPLSGRTIIAPCPKLFQSLTKELFPDYTEERYG